MEEVIAVCFGLIFGSFLNVVIHRLPLDRSVVLPRSHCPACRGAIESYDNIPVISYLILGGRCRYCKVRISFRYPAVEMFTALSFWMAYYYFRPDLVYVCLAAAFLCLIIALGLIDMDHMILPLELSIGGAVLFLVFSFFNPYLKPVHAFTASAGGALAFTILYFFYLKVRKIEGLGQGDIWMMLLMGAFLGPDKLIVAVLLATFAGLFTGIYFIIVKRKNLRLALPFGTFLAMGSFAALFWGTHILVWLHSIAGPPG